MAGQAPYLTIDKIVTNGLDLGGNPGVVAGATVFLQALLDHMFRSYDWDFLLKSVAITTDAGNNQMISAANLPTDYRAIRQLWVNFFQNTTVMTPLIQIRYENLLINILNDNNRGITSSGPPSHFALDTSASAANTGVPNPDVWLWPKPTAPVTMQLSYYRLPNVSSYLTGQAVDYPDAWALVGAVAHYAQKYDKESLQSILQQEAKILADEYRINHRDVGRAGVEVIPFDSVTFKTFKQDSQLPWPKPT